MSYNGKYVKSVPEWKPAAKDTIEPTKKWIDKGFEPTEKLPAQWLNFFFKMYSGNIKDLDTALQNVDSSLKKSDAIQSKHIGDKSIHLNKENVEDVVGRLLKAGTDIKLNYDDRNNRLTIDVNGNVLTKRDGGAVPVGTILWYGATKVPDGFLECNGAMLSKTTYARLFKVVGTKRNSSGTKFKLPDLRGEFIRGWSHNTIWDKGREFWTYQSDSIKKHRHKFGGDDQIGRYGYRVSGKFSYDARSGLSGNGRHYLTNHYGATGSETRPRNLALLPIIKY